MKFDLFSVGFFILAPVALQAQSPMPPPQASFRMAFGGGMGNQSFLGVGVADVDNNRARDLKLNDVYGVEITRVEDDSAAAKGGLKVGDIVLAYNGQRVEGGEQFIRLVHETPPGREVKLLISRNGATQTVPISMGSHKSNVVANRETWFTLPEVAPFPPITDTPRFYTSFNSPSLGIETEALTPQLASFFGAKEGVLVRSVIKDSAAEKAGIKAGDVIVKIDQTPVTTPSEVSGAVRAARSRKTFPVTFPLTLVRDKRESGVTVTMDGDLAPRNPRLRGNSIKMLPEPR